MNRLVAVPGASATLSGVLTGYASERENANGFSRGIGGSGPPLFFSDNLSSPANLNR